MAGSRHEMNRRLPRLVNALVQNELALKVVRSDAVSRALIKTLAASMEARDVIDRRVRAALERMDLVGRDEVDALRDEVAGLRERLDQTRGRLEAALDRLEARHSSSSKASS